MSGVKATAVLGLLIVFAGGAFWFSRDDRVSDRASNETAEAGHDETSTEAPRDEAPIEVNEAFEERRALAEVELEAAEVVNVGEPSEPGSATGETTSEVSPTEEDIEAMDETEDVPEAPALIFGQPNNPRAHAREYAVVGVLLEEIDREIERAEGAGESDRAESLRGRRSLLQTRSDNLARALETVTEP